MAGCSSRAACATCSPLPTSRWSGSSTRSTSGPRRAALRTRSVHPSVSSRPGCPPCPASIWISRGGAIRSVVWATGFHPDYRWLEVPVVDHKGHLRHDGGVVDAPGLYALGLPVLRRRKSTFIHGAEDDAREVIAHLAGYLSETVTADTHGPLSARVSGSRGSIETRPSPRRSAPAGCRPPARGGSRSCPRSPARVPAR